MQCKSNHMVTHTSSTFINPFSQVNPGYAVRIFSLQVNFWRGKNDLREAIAAGEHLKTFLLVHKKAAELETARSPVRGYQVYSDTSLNVFVDQLKQSRLITQVSELYSRGEYDRVVKILDSSLPKKVSTAQKKTSQGDGVVSGGLGL